MLAATPKNNNKTTEKKKKKKQLVTKSSGTILTFWRPPKLTTHCKVKKTLVFQGLQPALTVNVSSGKAFTFLSRYRQFPIWNVLNFYSRCFLSRVQTVIVIGLGIKFLKALYGTTGGTCSARLFCPVIIGIQKFWQLHFWNCKLTSKRNVKFIIKMHVLKCLSSICLCYTFSHKQTKMQTKMQSFTQSCSMQIRAEQNTTVSILN